jgi:hypothetical protein
MQRNITLLLFLFIIGCKTGKRNPDISNISITVHFESFKNTFITIYINHVQQGLLELAGNILIL